MNIAQLLRHWLVPHRSNNHRAKLLHIDALFAYALILLVFNLGIRFVSWQAPDVLGYATDIHVEQLLAATNAKRAEAGLPPLTLNPLLSAAAAAKAADMFAKGYWAHTGPDSKTPWDFIVSAGYRYSLAGENLAKNFQDSNGVVEAWMASATHRTNIIKPGYRDIGFAVINGRLNGEETTLVVQMFAAPAGQALVPPVQAARPVVTPAPVAKQPVEVVATVIATPSAFSSVVRRPLVDVRSFSREVIFVFVGAMMGVLAVDAVIVARRRVVRLTGHNIAHILFLAALLILIRSMPTGSLL